MKLTARQLRRIINEEISRLSEQDELDEFDWDVLMSISGQLPPLMVKLNSLDDPNLNTLSRIIMKIHALLPGVATKDDATLQKTLNTLKRYIDNTARSSR